MILKVKKPDYLGESMWEFRFGEHAIQVKVSDREWLEEFQLQRAFVHPGDSIRGIVEISHKYDYDGELTSTYYNLVKVKKILTAERPQQVDLFEDNTNKSNSETT